MEYKKEVLSQKSNDILIKLATIKGMSEYLKNEKCSDHFRKLYGEKIFKHVSDLIEIIEHEWIIKIKIEVENDK